MFHKNRERNVISKSEKDAFSQNYSNIPTWFPKIKERIGNKQYSYDKIINNRYIVEITEFKLI